MLRRAIVNPHASNNRTARRWPEIHALLEGALGPLESVFTTAPFEAARLATRAIHDGVEEIIAVGGDGTINEIVNGFFEQGSLINEKAGLAFLTSGTGGDFRKSFDIPADIEEQIGRIRDGAVQSVDIGRITFTDHYGREGSRYFVNIASFGLSGALDRAVNAMRIGKYLGGKAAYQLGLLKGMLTYANSDVRIRVDDEFDEEVNCCVAAVSNGRFFGSGMRIAPDASTRDGLFDVVIVSGISAVRLLSKVHTIYRGTHLQFDEVQVLRGRKIVAMPVHESGEVLLDVDGEAPGRLPATFEILPGALRLKI
jgi:diacylglycerol kinase (ATP)